MMNFIKKLGVLAAVMMISILAAISADEYSIILGSSAIYFCM